MLRLGHGADVGLALDHTQEAALVQLRSRTRVAIADGWTTLSWFFGFQYDAAARRAHRRTAVVSERFEFRIERVVGGAILIGLGVEPELPPLLPAMPIRLLPLSVKLPAGPGTFCSPFGAERRTPEIRALRSKDSG